MINFDPNTSAKKPYSLPELNRVGSISGLTETASFSGGFVNTTSPVIQTTSPS